jgi:hypothetical protein
MKKHLFVMIGLAASLTAAAQGKFEMKNFDGYSVHVYQPSGNAEGSLIVESKSGLVVINPSTDATFTEYLSLMNKPVAQNVKVADITRGTTQNWNNVNVTATFPLYGNQEVADVNIGGGLYFVHSLPAKAHASKQLVSNMEDIDKQLSNINILSRSGCSSFVDEYGKIADSEHIKFLQKYYNTMKKAYKKSSDAASFIAAISKAFPDLDGENNLQEVASALYSNNLAQN